LPFLSRAWTEPEASVLPHRAIERNAIERPAADIFHPSGWPKRSCSPPHDRPVPMWWRSGS